MIALWQACERYNPQYNPEKIASFFTFLYKGVLFECMKLCKTNGSFKENLKKIKHGNNINKIKSFYEEKRFSDFENQDLGLSEKDQKVVVDMFWKNKTVKELSKENNISQQAMKKRIDKILKNIKISSV
jgi:DNA-directed RNA polymerase specialized sigma subunit